MTPSLLNADLVEEILDLAAYAVDLPSNDLFRFISEASGRSEYELRALLDQKRQAIADQDADTYGAGGFGTRG